jgi:signal transduction histidine kinase
MGTTAMPPPAVAREQQQVLLLGVVGVVLAISGLHYLTSAHLLEYHTIYRSLYYVPIAGAAVGFGLRGGLGVSLLVTALYLPHVFGMGHMLPGGLFDNLLELPIFLLVGGLVGLLADRERAQRQRAETLRSYIDNVLQSLPIGVATASPPDAPVPQNRTAAALLATLPATPPLASLPLGYHTFDEGPRPLGLYLSPLATGAAGPDARVLVIEDQTERRALEAQLRRNDRLASVGQLAAGIAHEVRNPLAILRATAQLLAAQLGELPAGTRYSEVLIGEADRIEQLISELLAYARPRPPHLTAQDLATTLQRAAQAAQPYATQHEIALMVNAPEGQPIWADAEQLQQVLLNLLLNAVQASPPGRVVHLAGALVGGSAQIIVADEGVGMAPEVRERACDPFFTTRPEGVGLGLALVATMVGAQRGSLRIDSALGAGTTITICLPQEEPYGAPADH